MRVTFNKEPKPIIFKGSRNKPYYLGRLVDLPQKKKSNKALDIASLFIGIALVAAGLYGGLKRRW